MCMIMFLKDLLKYIIVWNVRIQKWYISEVINGYKSHVYKREDILRHGLTIAMIIELNHGIPGFDNDEIKDIFYYISTISILILSILFYFNKCTATDQSDCVYVWIKMFYNNCPTNY